MRKAYSLLVLGIWLTALPYLGFPHFWKDILTSFTGLGLICFSYALYKEIRSKQTKIEAFDNFSENKFFNQNDV